jgi:hypothetical protein
LSKLMLIPLALTLSWNVSRIMRPPMWIVKVPVAAPFLRLPFSPSQAGEVAADRRAGVGSEGRVCLRREG